MRTLCLEVKDTTLLLALLLMMSPRYVDDTSCFLTSAAPRLSASTACNKHNYYFSGKSSVSELHFLLLEGYVTNVAKRSIWDQCKKKYILRTDRRPATSDRPTTDQRHHIWEISNGHISARGRPIHFLFGSTLGFSRSADGVFGVGRSNGAISGFAKSNMAAKPPSWKIQMAISPRRIILFTPCMVLGWGFRGRRIKWRYFRFDQIQ